jgi:class 3 adenylate cyclase/tetratricopeptide (TPR) repeat protein
VNEPKGKREVAPPDKEVKKQDAQISPRKKGDHRERQGNRRRKTLDLDAIFKEVDRQTDSANNEAAARLMEALLPSPDNENPQAVAPLTSDDNQPVDANLLENLFPPQEIRSSAAKSEASVKAPSRGPVGDERRSKSSNLFSQLVEETQPRIPSSRDPHPGDESATFPSLSFSAESSQEQATQMGRLPIPPELEIYLPPELWRKLKGAEPPRGVLINALERVRSVLYMISTFLPRHLVQEKLRRPHAGQAKGQILNGAMLFSDVSGFTALSERLAAYGPEGAERLTAMMNHYFATMLEILARSGGILLKFAGDATLVYFPEQEANAHNNWALRASQRMLRAMSDFARIETPDGLVELRMKIGLASGEFLAASVGHERRMEYIVLGQAVTETMTAEGKTTGGSQLVINQIMRDHLSSSFSVSDLKDGFYLLTENVPETLDDFEIKAEERRARGAIPWDASPHAILAQIQVALRQIQALTPYLAPELVERLVVHARKRKVESEYRPTTVLFCNFAGPENLLNLWGHIGVRRITSLLNTYFTAMNEIISRYGGIIDRIDPYSSGSKMLAIFGAPVAHEDDPQRAVSTALAMNAELENLNEIWRRKFARYLPEDWNGPFIQHRIGVTYGEIFAGQIGASTRREYTVMGDDVNLAARLMSAAEMGRILLNKSVQEAVADYFVLTERAPIRVKGKSQPIPIYQVEGPQDDTLANRARCRGPLIGRDEDLAQSEAALRQAIEGNGSILTIQGPAGIGKSHLADAILNQATEQGINLQFNQCHSYNADIPFSCWGSLIRSLAGVTSIDYNPQIHHEKFRRLMERLSIPSISRPPLGALMGLRRSDVQAEARDPQAISKIPDGESEALVDLVKSGKIKRKASDLDIFQQLESRTATDAGQTWNQMPQHLGNRERQELQQALLDLFENLSLIAPHVIFFEDAHWMDVPSAELLSFLEGHIQNFRLLFLIARRGAGPDDLEDLGQTINLGPLSQDGTSALVTHLLISDLAQVIQEQSLGNPLLISEIMHWFRRTYRINAEELKSVLKTSDFLQKLVLSGLENLPERQREIARAASVIGQEFRTGEIQALLSSTLDTVTLSNHLRALVRERLFTLSEAGADARYIFQQALVRDILYNSLPHEQRRELHARVAEYLSDPTNERRRIQARIAAALETTPVVNPFQEAETIGFHFEQAGLWLEAARNLLVAADLTRSRGMHEKAASYYSRALEDLDQVSPQVSDLETDSLHTKALIGLGDVSLITGDYLTATTAYETACKSQPGTTTPQEKIDLNCKLALVLPTQGRASEAIQVLRNLLGTPPKTQDVIPTLTMAWLFWRTGRAKTEHWIERGKDLLASSSSSLSQNLYTFVMDLEGEWTNALLGYAAFNQSVGAALAAIHAGDRYLKRENYPTAMDFYRQAGELLQYEPPQTNGVLLALYQQAEVHWRLKDDSAARDSLENALSKLDQSAPSLQAHGRTAIQKALKAVDRGYKRWPTLNWQTYDDEFRINYLFQALQTKVDHFG